MSQPAISRRDFLLGAGRGALALTAAGSLAGGALHAAEKRPLNFIFILFDDMGWTDAACWGSDFYETPNIDALMRRSMRFTSAYAACPVCSPTRASIMTGKYPARLHLTNYTPNSKPAADHRIIGPKFVKAIPESEVTIAQALKNAGYACASIGKWDIGNAPSSPTMKGFDINIGGNAGGMAKSHFYPAWKGNPAIEGRDGEYLADRLTEEAEKFMEANKNRPFFVYLSHYSVHIPLEAKQEYIDSFSAKVKPEKRHKHPIYAAMVKSADESVGRVMRKLDQLGIADRTVVMLMSDNGGLNIAQMSDRPVTCNLPLREGKGHVYEGGIRVPMIVHWPGVTDPASTCDVPVCSVDIYRTMLDMIGRKPAEGQALDSQSLTPLLRGARSINRDSLYWHYPHYSPQGGLPASAIRSGRYKLLRFWHDDHTELYDLSADISESNDLARSQPATAARLNAKLSHWLRQVGADLPVANPDYTGQ